MVLSISQLEMLRGLILRRTGIMYPKRKDFLLESRLQALQRSCGYSNLAVLLDALKSDDTLLWDRFIKAFTTNHTYLFRESEHFDLLTDDIRRRGMDGIRIWVAAASTGEEVYSIAMQLQSHGYLDYRIMASDINKQNLLTMKKGVYGLSRFRFTPETLRKRYFQALGGLHVEPLYLVKPILRQNIFARVLNLTHNLRFEQPFHYIFCRNVLMYFEPRVQSMVISMLESNLESGGMLFLGHSETMIEPSPNLVMEDMACYRKRGGAR